MERRNKRMELRSVRPEDVYRMGHPSWDVSACAQVIEVTRTEPGRSIHVA
jgi:hypothetical protein